MSKTDLEISVASDGRIDFVVVDGPVDSATIDHFKERLDPVCNNPSAKVVLDCQRMTYLNSRAIGMLVKYHRTLLAGRGCLVIFGLNPKMVRTLELLQLGKALFIHDTREQAVAAVTS